MTRLRDRNVFPPGGWQFVQAETGWKIPKPFEVNFAQAVELIIAHRKANPTLPLATDFASVAWELEGRTIARLETVAPNFLVDLSPALAATHEPAKRCRSCGR